MLDTLHNALNEPPYFHQTHSRQIYVPVSLGDQIKVHIAEPENVDQNTLAVLYMPGYRVKIDGPLGVELEKVVLASKKARFGAVVYRGHEGSLGTIRNGSLTDYR